MTSIDCARSPSSLIVTEPVVVAPIKVKYAETDDLVLFSGDIYTQWLKRDITIGEKTFNTCEQYMMWCKAIECDDLESAEKIYEEKEPKQQKIYGRAVKNFDDDKWNLIADKYVYEANYAKFTQYDDLKEKLLATGDKLIAECGTYDRRWANGLSIEDALKIPPNEWIGENRLGKAIMRVRDELNEQINCESSRSLSRSLSYL
jgi:hypothetical protein